MPTFVVNLIFNLKQSITIFLILIIFLQTFSRFVVEADYFINIGYIVKNLCINKEKPKMHCDGKCYLAKQLNEQQKQEQAPVSKKDKLEIQLFLALQEHKDARIFSYSPKDYYTFNDVRLTSFPRSIFHPPSA